MITKYAKGYKECQTLISQLDEIIDQAQHLHSMGAKLQESIMPPKRIGTCDFCDTHVWENEDFIAIKQMFVRHEDCNEKNNDYGRDNK